MEIPIAKDIGSLQPWASLLPTYPLIATALSPLLNIHERFCWTLESDLLDLFPKGVVLRFISLQEMAWGEVLNRLKRPLSIQGLVADDLETPIAILADREFVHLGVDCFFGGKGEGLAQEDYTNSSAMLTATETRWLQCFTDRLGKALVFSWEKAYDLQFEKNDCTALAESTFRHNHAFLACIFEIRVEQQLSHFWILYPLEIQAVLTKQDVQYDVWRKQLHQQILEAPLNLKSVVLRQKIPLKEVQMLKKGDILDIDFAEQSTLYVDELPLFNTKLGQISDKFVLKIEGAVINGSR